MVEASLATAPASEEWMTGQGLTSKQVTSVAWHIMRIDARPTTNSVDPVDASGSEDWWFSAL